LITANRPVDLMADIPIEIEEIEALMDRRRGRAPLRRPMRLRSLV
jgi:hypothetical protein